MLSMLYEQSPGRCLSRDANHQAHNCLFLIHILQRECNVKYDLRAEGIDLGCKCIE